MQYETINFGVAEGVAHIEFARPQQANTVNPAFSDELAHAAARCRDEAEIRAVLVSAAAGPLFSAGGDLGYLGSQGNNSATAMSELIDRFHPGIEILATMDAPVVMAINGVAAGAGFSMALIGSVVYATPKSAFTMAYTAAGLSPDGGSTFFLPRIVGLRRAEELMLTNRKLSAEEAHQWGIVSKVVDEADIMEVARAMAVHLAQGATGAFGRVRRLLHASLGVELHDQLRREQDEIVAAISGHDGREGIDAFLNKRRPVFRGE